MSDRDVNELQEDVERSSADLGAGAPGVDADSAARLAFQSDVATLQ